MTLGVMAASWYAGDAPEMLSVISVPDTDHWSPSGTKALSAAVYDDDAAAWRAVREFASARQLEHAEELVERPKKVAPAPPVASPDDPF